MKKERNKSKEVKDARWQGVQGGERVRTQETEMGWAVGWRTFLERVTRKGLLEKKTSGQRLKEPRIQGDGEGLLDRRSIRWKGPMAEGRGGISTGEKEGG